MIERLYVSNFRCLENFAIEFAAYPSALIIGKNGCGKSTLCDALSIFQSICRGSNRVKQLIGGDDFTQQRKNIPMRFEIDVVLDRKRFSFAISFELPDNFREARVAEESLAVDGEMVYSRKLAQISLSGGTTFGIDWHTVALPLINQKPGETSIDRLRAFFASMILISPIPSLMSGFSEQESFELQRDAVNFSSWLNAYTLRFPATYSVLHSYLKSVIPDFDSFENPPKGENGTQLHVNFEQPDSRARMTIDFKRLSDGEKCFFLSALVVASSKVNGPIFCMWDEPDIHLSLPEIQHFITQLRKLANQHGQLIVTSHHPEIIRSFSDESTIVFSRRSHLEPTIVQKLSDISYNGDLIEAISRDEIIG